MPFGAELQPGGGARFRLWAPAAHEVALRLEDENGGLDLPMTPLEEGWFERLVPEAVAGQRYRYRLDGETLVPEPASRFQTEDVHGPSELIDPRAFPWPDGSWRGRPWEETVLYELHVGSFTPSGTYQGATGKLDRLVELGVTAIELMPLAESPGGRNWGYDGVYLFAPEHRYGGPDALKRLIAEAHARDLMVFLDVVYNHFGPEGNYLHRSAPGFFTERRHTPWGAAIDFEGPQAATVRDFFIQNALYWLAEFNIDGLRLDAVHAIFDGSDRHFLVELAERVRAAAPPGREIHLVLENDDNAPTYLARDNHERPRWFTAQWNDDIHHVLHSLATGETEGYYGDYAERPVARLGRTLAEGFDYQGQASAHRSGAARGAPSAHLPPTAFVGFLQNHDQIGNRAFGDRIDRLAPPAAVEAALAILLLAPSIPLLFMGEEWAASEPFPFFCDFGPDLADAVRDGRRREFAKFAAFADEAARARIPDPMARRTFDSAVLDWSACDRPEHRKRFRFCRRLLALRRAEIVPRLSGARTQAMQEDGGLLRVVWRMGDGMRLTLLANMAPTGCTGTAADLAERLLFSTKGPGDAARPGTPAWFVAWHLGEAIPGA